MTPLSKRQKFILADLANQAYARMLRGYRAEATPDDFRHHHVTVAVGKSGLTSCDQADYKPVMAHFLQLLGRDGEALNAHVRDQTNGRRIAWHKLREACARAKVTLNYPDAICRSKYKCALDHATDAQLWKLKYDVDRAAKRRRGYAITNDAD